MLCIVILSGLTLGWLMQPDAGNVHVSPHRRDGSMARTPQLLEFAQQHGLVAITIDDLARYIQQQQQHNEQ